MSRSNRAIVAAILGLGLAVAVLSIASARLGPTVDSMMTLQEFDGSSTSTPIQVTFTEPMDVRSVQRNFRVVPKVAGSFNWSGDQLLFRPNKVLSYSTKYRVEIGAGAVSASGKHMYRRYIGSFTTQAPHLLYLGTQGDEQYRLVLASIDGHRDVLGDAGVQVTDYSLSFDRSLIVYVSRRPGATHANDLSLLSLGDGKSRHVFSHPGWDISEPHLSPDNKTIVFLATNVRLCQKYYGCTLDKTGPVVFLLSLNTLKATRFQPRSAAPLTYFIDFSPAGQVAYTDLGSALTLANVSGRGVVHIPNLGNSPEYAGFDPKGDKAAFVGQTPSSSGGDILVYESRVNRYTDVSQHVYDSSTPSFSNSGTRIAYAGYQTEKGIEPVYGVNVYDFATHTTRHITHEREWSDWAPVWSGNDRYIAFVRSAPQEAMYMGSGEVWIANSDGTGARPIGGVGKKVRWVS
ncbi:MAG: hypothetical protein NVS2B16_06330 [Chloroflexota bacterium]